MLKALQQLGGLVGRKVRPSEQSLQGFLRSDRARSIERFGRKSPISNHLDSLRRLTSMFDPVKAGQNDALYGEPNLDAGLQSRFESRVITSFQNELNDQRGLIEKNIRHTDAVLKESLPPEPVLEAKRILAQVEANQNGVLAEWEPRLVNARREVNRSKIALDTFRFNNKPAYERPAKYPPRIVAVISMGAVLSLEMLLNYNFLLIAGANKPAEIFLIVFITALINLVLSSCIGLFGARNLGHVQRMQKAKGAAIILVLSCIVFCFHMVLAHYRLALDNVLADPTAALDAARRSKEIAQIPTAMGNTITATPWAFLRDLHSVIVFLMGLIFALIAAIEGYYLITDPYPGYQAKDKAYHEAREAFSSSMREFEGATEKPTEDAGEAISTILRQGEFRLNVLKVHFDDAVAGKNTYEQEASQLEYSMWSIIDSYRSTYRTIKGTGPAHWNEDGFPHLDREINFELEDIARIEEEQTSILSALRSQAAQLHAQLTENMTDLLHRLKEYLETIDQDAQRLEDMAHHHLFGERRPAPPSSKG